MKFTGPEDGVESRLPISIVGMLSWPFNFPLAFRSPYISYTMIVLTAICIFFCIGKRQQVYDNLLRAVLRATDDVGATADPSTVLCDFETAAMNAVGAVFGDHVDVQGCFYHLCQSTYRKIQELGLVEDYKSRDDVKLFAGMLDALAFLPVADVAAGMKFLSRNVPDCAGLQDLLVYFDSTYVNGTARMINRRQQSQQASATSIQPIRVRRIPPLFPPPKWNVHEATLANQPRTNNECESWNNAYRSLVGHCHPSMWTTVNALQQDQAMATTAILQHARGQPPAKRVRRQTVRLQERLHRLCTSYKDGGMNMEAFLRGVGHTIRM